MPGRTALRLAILAVEAAFIVAVAVVGAVVGLGWWTLAPVAAAWAVTVASERLVTRLEAKPGSAGSTVPAVAAGTSSMAATESAPAVESHVRVLRKEPVAPQAVEDSGVAPEQPVETPPAQPPAPPAPEPAPEPVAAEPPPAAPEPEPAAAEPPPPAPEPEPEPAPFVPPVLTSVPALEPEPPAPVAAHPAAQSDVIQLEPRGPRGWNIWDLERLTKEHSGVDAFRDEERSYLLVYLREFANADGLLPIDFDALVRESFGDLVGTG